MLKSRFSRRQILPWVWLVFAAGGCITACAGEALIFPSAGWKRISSKDLEKRWDNSVLEEAKTQWTAMRDHHESTALMVVERGRVVLSQGPVDLPVGCHSMRKSFLSALYGTLQPAQALPLNATMQSLGIDDQSPLTASEKQATLKDLLTARSGIYHPSNYETSAMKSDRPERGSHPPGTFFHYNNWDFNALGTIFTQLSGKGVGEAFDTAFAKPLGMEDFTLSRDFQLYWDAGKRPSIHPAYPFQLSTRDRARFGLLFLAKGQWAGEQIVPEKWVRTSTRAYSAHSFGKGSEELGTGKAYGMLWWCSDEQWHFGCKFPDNTTYSARGVGGQYIVIVPSRSLVIVHTNDMRQKGAKEPGADFNKLFQTIIQAQVTKLVH